MQIIIDAYNLIKKIYSSSFASRYQIESCIQMLVQYASMKNHRLIIIFDGGEGLFLTKKHYSDLCQLWWVGSGLKADDCIKELLDEKYRCHLLVSCDRELVVYAQNNKIPSIEVAFFWEFVKKAIELPKQNKQNLKKDNLNISFKERGVMNDLMDEFGFQGEFKEVAEEENKIFLKKKHLSKLEIQLYTIIKKL